MANRKNTVKDELDSATQAAVELASILNDLLHLARGRDVGGFIGANEAERIEQAESRWNMLATARNDRLQTIHKVIDRFPTRWPRVKIIGIARGSFHEAVSALTVEVGGVFLSASQIAALEILSAKRRKNKELCFADYWPIAAKELAKLRLFIFGNVIDAMRSESREGLRPIANPQ